MHLSADMQTTVRGLHGGVQVGLCNLFVQHTSASLTINENASPDVPLDLNVRTYPGPCCVLCLQPQMLCLMRAVATVLLRTCVHGRASRSLCF